jgi:hypothetical protein
MGIYLTALNHGQLQVGNEVIIWILYQLQIEKYFNNLHPLVILVNLSNK